MTHLPADQDDVPFCVYLLVPELASEMPSLLGLPEDDVPLVIERCDRAMVCVVLILFGFLYFKRFSLPSCDYSCTINAE